MRVLVLGGGYAGVVLTRALEDTLPSDVDILVVDESGQHLVQHELHRIVRRPELVDTIRVPLTELFERASVHRGTVVDVDTDARSVELSDGEVVEYDVGAVCLGAETNFHGMDDIEAHAHPLKRVAHAEAIRAAVLDAFDDPPSKPSSLVVGGAGLAGVQLAGELAALAEEEGADAGVVLLEQASRIVPTFDESFARALDEELTACGVDVRTGQTVTGASAREISLDSGATVQYDVFAWTGGIRGPGAIRGERLGVRSTLALDDRTFVVGDAGRVVDDSGEPVPASAQAAVREARLAAKNVYRAVQAVRDGGVFSPRFERFTFDAPGWLVSVGDGAVAQVGTTVLRGPAAMTLKSGVGAGYLVSTGALENAVSFVRAEYGRQPDE